MIYAIETSKDLDSIDAELYVANVSEISQSQAGRAISIRGLERRELLDCLPGNAS
jgi:hypothetical protein